MNKALLQAFLIVPLLLISNAYTFAEDDEVSNEMKQHEAVISDELKRSNIETVEAYPATTTKMELTTKAERESQIVQLKVNEEASIDKARLVIHLIRIVEDERCPVNIGCYWSGHVKVEIVVSINTVNYGHHFISNVNNELRNLSSEIILDKYTIKLGFKGVLPERVHQGSEKEIAEIMPQEYEVELVIDQ